MSARVVYVPPGKPVPAEPHHCELPDKDQFQGVVGTLLQCEECGALSRWSRTEFGYCRWEGVYRFRWRLKRIAAYQAALAELAEVQKGGNP